VNSEDVPEAGPDLVAEDRAALDGFFASLRESVAEKSKPEPEEILDSHEGLKWGWRATGDKRDGAGTEESPGTDTLSPKSPRSPGSALSPRSPRPGNRPVSKVTTPEGTVAPVGTFDAGIGDGAADRFSGPSQPPARRLAPASSLGTGAGRNRRQRRPPDYRWHNAAIVSLLILCCVLAYLAFLT